MAKGIVASMGWLWDESVAESRAFIDSEKGTVGYPGFNLSSSLLWILYLPMIFLGYSG